MIKSIGENSYVGDIEEIHSFDAYYKNVVLRNNNLIIPYINLGISSHPINRTDKMMYINFCYAVFENISYLSVYLQNKRYFVIGDKNQRLVYNFGGSYLDFEERIFNDMEISCETAYLQTIDKTQISEDMWIPNKTTKYNANIDQFDVENFFNFNLLPISIVELMK